MSSVTKLEIELVQAKQQLGDALNDAHEFNTAPDADASVNSIADQGTPGTYGRPSVPEKFKEGFKKSKYMGNLFKKKDKTEK